METMSVTSVSALFPETKSEIKVFASKMIESVLSGYESPLKVKVQLSAMKKTIDEIESSEEFKNAVLNETEKYHPTELKDLYNSNIQIKETGVKYDYLACGMPEYERICNEIEKLSQRKKELEKRLQTITKEEEFIDPESGEIILLQPALKTSTTSVVITINK